MTSRLPAAIAELRLLVGFLGEQSQYHWWSSRFLATTSEAFLLPVFPRTTLLAQYHGVCEAARLKHDEHIGIGRHDHLYRLPEALEQAMAQAVSAPDFAPRIKPLLASTASAIARLAAMATSATEKREGPVLLDHCDHDRLDALIQQGAGQYQAAFSAGYQCFPYLQAN
ncbi:hypothetical protein Thiowin_03249 [Thiorhodovibrio winogradskyi]|uniref:BrxE family protein n=1 Tax=Thiorhodovibrio winogradskyi TaxID=77007 RepID=A0ABZ0SEY5_9GAMM|nr:BrxE family protein [Thiorhodovibrio winogradskyi]